MTKKWHIPAEGAILEGTDIGPFRSLALYRMYSRDEDTLVFTPTNRMDFSDPIVLTRAQFEENGGKWFKSYHIRTSADRNATSIETFGWWPRLGEELYRKSPEGQALLRELGRIR